MREEECSHDFVPIFAQAITVKEYKEILDNTPMFVRKRIADQLAASLVPFLVGIRCTKCGKNRYD